MDEQWFHSLILELIPANGYLGRAQRTEKWQIMEWKRGRERELDELKAHVSISASLLLMVGAAGYHSRGFEVEHVLTGTN